MPHDGMRTSLITALSIEPLRRLFGRLCARMQVLITTLRIYHRANNTTISIVVFEIILIDRNLTILKEVKRRYQISFMPTQMPASLVAA